MKIEVLYNIFKECSTVSTDTRKLTKDCMYFALRGDNFDGNKFASQALKAGAKYCIIDDAQAVVDKRTILVNDVLTTLQNLAAYHRTAIAIPIIALTGSNGKTTTKELIHAVLSTTYKVKATTGNLNNHIGVPLTLLKFDESLDFGIVEMGANHQKEIEFLTNITQPDYGLITNFGKAHLEGFGGIEGVIKGKSELYDYLKENNKTVFLNTNDPLQVKQVGNYTSCITFGSKAESDCVIKLNNANPFVSLQYDGKTITSQLIGSYNFNNIAIAVTVGKQFKVATEHIKNAIEAYRPDNNRSEIIKKNSNTIILDAYNANPTSMIAAIENLKQLEAVNKYLFLGDMFELGDEAVKEHQAILSYAETNFDKNIIVIGENFYNTKASNSTLKFSKFDDLKAQFQSFQFNNATILIKGSRGMALERILTLL
ncbi:MAG: UDP-N-acetylmuramoyl-tripeptide--D-alanyl-D-alanine ligase [Winogradskyella sp.]|uniref:UDP-N-acetylmuramoyl-tripeptide--D-alanyl-D- alanine ligase n=1 Tax=Winogradskyella sp. TaxID=1883156 RepID=UPI0017DCAC7E|nr:UDP-N-acetylmuramoyl-tripeptide--D-alanyl-D-alanine ligase [Winogradskyella sp.]